MVVVGSSEKEQPIRPILYVAGLNLDSDSTEIIKYDKNQWEVIVTSFGIRVGFSAFSSIVGTDKFILFGGVPDDSETSKSLQFFSFDDQGDFKNHYDGVKMDDFDDIVADDIVSPDYFCGNQCLTTKAG